MQAHRQAVSHRGVEYARALRRRECDALAERVNGVGKALGGGARDDRPAHEIEVGVAAVLVFGRKRVGGEEGTRYAHIEAFAQGAGDPQHPQFSLDIQPVTGLYLNGGNAMCCQRFQPPRGCVA